jgi:transposase
MERRDYLKLHIMVGTKTNVITAAAVTDRNTNDSPMLPALLNETATYFTVNEVSADKGYSSKNNLATITGFGAKPFVAFKSTAIGQTTSRIWNKAFHFFLMNQEEFQARYHRRSNVESTFSAMKRKLGDTLRSKTPVAQRNELLLKVLCHNLICLIHEIHESGAIALFPSLADGCTRNRKVAQKGDAETV